MKRSAGDRVPCRGVGQRPDLPITIFLPLSQALERGLGVR